MKKRIGFLSYWGFGRGLAMVTLGFAKMIQDEYDIYILQQGKNEIAEEFKVVDANITEIPTYQVPPEVFKMWITENKLDAVVFNEYGQWAQEPNNLIELAKQLGVKVYGEFVMERFEKEQTEGYDRIFVPTVSFERFMRMNKVRNFTYVPYSIDLEEFPADHEVFEKNEKFTFFHPGGFGGVHERKNTIAVIEAFENMKDVEICKLLITSQKQLRFKRELHPNIEIVNKNVSRKELIDYYYKSDAVVLPSKWETIGIPILESLASGTPVITSNMPPMNEFIRPGLNGYVCSGENAKYENITINAIDVDIRDLKNKMQSIMNQTLYPMLCRNSRHIVENIYNLEKNKHYLLDFLKKDLGENK